MWWGHTLTQRHTQPPLLVLWTLPPSQPTRRFGEQTIVTCCRKKSLLPISAYPIFKATPSLTYTYSETSVLLYVMSSLLSIKAMLSSGIAKLGHTGARALETRGCAPPMQALLKIISVECTVINRELGAKSSQRCWNRAAQYIYIYLYPPNNEVSYAPLISMYACLLQVQQWPYAARAQVRNEGMLQFKATVWPKVASEST